MRAVVALLQLDRVRAALLGDVEHLLALLEIALMVVADLGDHVAIRAVVDLEAVDDEFARHELHPVCCHKNDDDRCDTIKTGSGRAHHGVTNFPISADRNARPQDGSTTATAVRVTLIPRHVRRIACLLKDIRLETASPPVTFGLFMN